MGTQVGSRFERQLHRMQSRFHLSTQNICQKSLRSVLLSHPRASVDAVGIHDRNFRLNLREFSASSLTCITSGAAAAAAAVAFATLANGNGHLVI